MRQAARRRAGIKLAFLIHLTAYVTVNILLVTINLVTSPGYLWSLWPLLGWGIGIVFHGLATYAFGERSPIMKRMIEKEIQSLAETDPDRIRFFPGFIPDERAGLFLQAADVLRGGADGP